MAIAEATIARITGSAVVGQRRFPGGDISGASEVQLADGRVVVAKQGPVVSVEGRMLQAMGRSEAPVPQIVGQMEDVLVIERLPAGGALTEGSWSSLAAALQTLHALGGQAYGWPEDYALRQVRVENGEADDWPRFWADRRLRCHLPHLPGALRGRIEALARQLPDLLPASPRPALLHGDLWGGNVLVGADDGITGLIDPCAFYGDREVDAASLTVFDAPPAAFFDALGLEQGWRARQPIYRLWMWLVHVRLFGAGYVAAAQRELDTLGF